MNRGLRSGSGESVLSWVGWSIKLGGLVDNSLGGDGERSLTGVERSTCLGMPELLTMKPPHGGLQYDTLVSRWARATTK